MSLQDFVEQYTSPGQPTDFLVKADLIESYTKWRQLDWQPTMQLADLDAAYNDSTLALPPEDYRDELLVELGGKKGLVKDCWQGYILTWENGNKTQPESFEEQPGEEYTSDDRKVHGCFHFQRETGYSSGQLDSYVKNRVTQTFPDDLDDLQGKVRAVVKELEKELANNSLASWKVKPVHHEGLLFNVFVGNGELTA